MSVGACLALLLSDRLLATHTPVAIFLALGSLPIVAGVIVGLLHKPSDQEVAAIVDERLGLKNQLTSGLYAQTLPEDPFARRVVDDAQRTAADVRLSHAAPIRPSPWWLAAAVLLIAGVFSYYLVPERDLLGFEARRKLAKEEKQDAEKAVEEVKKATEAMEELRKHDNDALSKDAQESLAELAQMTQQDLSNPALKRDAEAQISKLEEKLEQEADEKQQALDSLQNSLSKIDSKTPGPANKFEDAMRRGDYSAAAEALKELAEAVDNMPKEDREQLTQQMAEIARQLDEAAQKFEQEQKEKQEALEKELADAGLSKQEAEELAKEMKEGGEAKKSADDSKNEKDGKNDKDGKNGKGEKDQKPKMTKEEMQKKLENKGIPPDKAKQLAEKMEQSQKEGESCENSSEATKSLAEALKKSAAEGKDSNGDKPGDGKSSDAAQKQLEQMARMKESLNRMRQSNKQLRDVMKQMGQKGNGGGEKIGQDGNGDKSQQQEQVAGGGGGDQWGRGAGGNPLGGERDPLENVKVEGVGNPGEAKGKVITSWDESGPMSKGEAKLTYDRELTTARDQADKAIEEDRVPVKYRKTIKDYFDQVPSSPEGVKAAP